MVQTRKGAAREAAAAARRRRAEEARISSEREIEEATVHLHQDQPTVEGQEIRQQSEAELSSDASGSDSQISIDLNEPELQGTSIAPDSQSQSSRSSTSSQFLRPAPPLPVPHPTMAAQIRFARFPGQADRQLINYDSPEGHKLFKVNAAPLRIEYDLSAAKLPVFLKLLRQRVERANWWPTITMQHDGRTLNLIRNYGELSLNTVRQHAEQYQQAENRTAQDSSQLFTCLMSSLEMRAQERVVRDETAYQVDGHDDGALLLKIIVSKAHVDTNATANTLLNRVSNLPSFMMKCDNDILKFNDQVKDLRQRLEALGKSSEGMLLNLFKGYSACEDTAFRDYMRRKQELSDEGPEISLDEALNLAENFYFRALDNETWMEPTLEQKSVLALAAQLRNFKEQHRKQNFENKSKQGKTKSKEGGKTFKHPWFKRASPWQLKRGDTSKTKINRKNKEYFWCQHHEMWTRHDPAECHLAPNSSNSATSSRNTKKNDSDENQLKLKVQRALTAVVEEDEDYE